MCHEEGYLLAIVTEINVHGRVVVSHLDDLKSTDTSRKEFKVILEVKEENDS